MSVITHLDMNRCGFSPNDGSSNPIVKPPAGLGVSVPPVLTRGVCVPPPQWVPRWAEPSGYASLRLCPRLGLSPASWRTCRGPWWASAWACWSCAATKRVCRSNAPGGSLSSPSSPSSSSPSSGTSSPTSCWGCRSRPLPDEGPTPALHPLVWPTPTLDPISYTLNMFTDSKQRLFLPTKSKQTNKKNAISALSSIQMWKQIIQIQKSTRNLFYRFFANQRKYVSFIKEGLQ